LQLVALIACDAPSSDDPTGQGGEGGRELGPLPATTSSSTAGSGGSPGDADLPTPWDFDDEGEDVAPALDVQARAGLIHDALDAALGNPVDAAGDALLALLEAARQTDDGCPAETIASNEDGTQITSIWYGPCADEAGITIVGAGSITRHLGWVDEETGRLRTGIELQSIDAYLDAADGRHFEGAFYVGSYDEDLDTSKLSFRIFVGTVDAAAFDAHGEVKPVVTPAELGVITHHDVEALDTLLVYADGGVTLDGRAVTFSDFTVGDAYAAVCPEEPTGAVAIRDVDGNTYDVTFDGVGEDGAPTSDCDACGVTTFRGHELEASCVDTTTLLDLENAPW